MARNLVEQSICDYCEGEAVKTFTISEGTRSAVLDVCDKHAKPLDEALSKGSGAPRRRASSGEKPSVHRVIPVD